MSKFHELLEKFALFFLVGFVCFGLGLFSATKSFVKKDEPQEQSLKDKSKEKKSGTKIVYMPSKCDGQPQEIASVETFDSEIKNDIKSESKKTSRRIGIAGGKNGVDVLSLSKQFGEVPILEVPYSLGADLNYKKLEDSRLKLEFDY